MKILSFSFLFFILISPSFAEQNVIFITMDGVRYREIFQGVRFPGKADAKKGSPLIPDVLRIMKADGFSYGNRLKFESTMQVSTNSNVSQPGYRALFTGQYEGVCKKNNCPMIDRETLIDALIDSGVDAKKVASFASWEKLNLVLESKPTRAVRSVAFSPITGLSKEEAQEFQSIEEKALNDRPAWHGSRRDVYTFDMGLQYLTKYRPRFLYLMFVDPDEHGHRKDYKGYLQSLRDFNERFKQLLQRLSEMGEYGENTSIVITTDHGRGRSFLWSEHSREWIDSKRIWAFVYPAKKLRQQHQIQTVKRGKYYQVDIRPTLELLLGMPKVPREGQAMIELKPLTI